MLFNISLYLTEPSVVLKTNTFPPFFYIFVTKMHIFFNNLCGELYYSLHDRLHQQHIQYTHINMNRNYKVRTKNIKVCIIGHQ